MKVKGTVAVVINTSWNVYNFRLNLLRAIQREGYRVVVIAPRDAYSDKLTAEGFFFEDLKLNNDSTNTIREIVLFLDLLRLYRKIGPDIILHYTIKPNIYGTLAARFVGKPVINNISGLGTVFLSDNLSSWVARGLLWLTQRSAKKVFFQNNDDMQIFLKYWFVSRSRAERIPGSGIDTAYFAPVKKRSEDLTFLFIGRLIMDKGIGEYIDAIRMVKRHYPDVRFQIVGSLYHQNPTATTQAQLSAWIREGLVEYLGHTDDIRILIAEASCIVLPSYREGLSRSLLEAASMARPIVTTDVPGCRDVVDDGVNGYLCRVRDVEDLADKIVQMIRAGEAVRAEMGAAGRQKVLDEFSDKFIIKKYLQYIKKIKYI